MPIRRHEHTTQTTSRSRPHPCALIGVTALLGLSLTACTGALPLTTPSSAPPPPTAKPTASPQPLPTASEPTAIPPYDFMEHSPLMGEPADTPEGTFELYLRDAVRETERIQQRRLALRLHYEPSTTVNPDLGGLVASVRLIEDRSTHTMPSENTAIFAGNFDVMVTFADQSTSMRYCDWTVTLERAQGKWYVINPSELPLFSVCKA